MRGETRVDSKRARLHATAAKAKRTQDESSFAPPTRRRSLAPPRGRSTREKIRHKSYGDANDAWRPAKPPFSVSGTLPMYASLSRSETHMSTSVISDTRSQSWGSTIL